MYKYLFFFYFLSVSLFGASSLAVSPEKVENNLKKYIQIHAQAPNLIGHLYIGDHEKQINQGTYLYVKNALDYYREKRPAFIILELDSPGGQLYPAQRISDALKEIDIHYGIPVVAFINNWAMSAGAMLAYSCRYIAVVKDASMGAAQPISQSGEKTSEKMNSAVRTDFANRASFFDRNPLIAEAMVDADIILVLRDGKILKLNDENQIKDSDRLISAKGKLLTLNSRELIEYGVADIDLTPTKLEPMTEEEQKTGVWPSSKELLFTYPFFKEIPNAVIDSYRMDWKTHFFSLLSTPIVTSLLLLGLMISFYVELNTPGFGVAGAFGLVCLFLIILSSFSIQAASWLEILILIAGIGLILLEVFVIPGFGVTGILGISLAVIGLFALLLPGIKEMNFDFDTRTFNAAGEFILERVAWLAGTLVAGVLAIALLGRWIAPKYALFSPLVLRGEQEGYVAGLEVSQLPTVGSEGVAFTPLKTAGKVIINEIFFDAFSSGNFIEKGAKIRVMSLEGNKIIVEENV
jgi:membrane-bound serine protease (ClpP class)